MKFFRKIRQRLLSENRFNKYLLYAIGEIILVVIGILIALQINNWNEAQKDFAREQEILIQIKEDYEANLEQLENKIGMRDSIIAASHYILKSIDGEFKLHEDNLVIKLCQIAVDPTFDPIENDLIASGNIRLIRNKELKRLLSNWSSDIVALQEIETLWSKELMNRFFPYATNNGMVRNTLDKWFIDPAFQTFFLEDSVTSAFKSIGKSKRKIDVDAVLEDIEFEGILAIAYSFNQSGNQQSIALKKRIEQILFLLDQEITEK